MQLNINIESTITAALESALAPDRIREQIEKQIAGTVDAAIKDAFREFSDFGKTVKEAVAGVVPHDLSLEGAANWNHAINQIIRERLSAVNNERIAQAINPMLDKLLVQPPKELKVSELVRKAAEMWGDSWKRDGSDRPSVEIEHSEGVMMDFYRIKMDPRQTRESYRSWPVDIAVTGEGNVYGLRIDGQDMKNTKFAGRFYDFEAYIFALYTGGTKLVLDTEDFDDIYYGEENDDGY